MARSRYVSGELSVEEFVAQVAAALEQQAPQYDSRTEVHVWFDGGEPLPIHLHI